MDFGNGVKNIQAAAYNGARTVYDMYDQSKRVKMQQYFGLTLAKRRNGQTTGTCMMAKGSFSRGQVTKG